MAHNLKHVKTYLLYFFRGIYLILRTLSERTQLLNRSHSFESVKTHAALYTELCSFFLLSERGKYIILEGEKII